MQKVICRNNVENSATVGDFYFIDRSTIWIDRDGNVMGIVYDSNQNRICEMKLSCFYTA